jgi:tetratricopeptide (TPR) repeat protein
VAGITGLRPRWVAIGLCLVGVVAAVDCAHAADGALVAGLNRAILAEESRGGRASPHLLPLLDRLAGVQFNDGALAQAANSRRRGLNIAIAAYGSNSANAAKAMTALAQIDILRFRYIDAEPLLTVAVDVLGERLGADNPALSEPLAALARIAVAHGEFDRAERLAGRANVLSGHDPGRSAEALRALGAAYAGEQRFGDGEAVLRQAVARDRKAHGDAALETARSLAQLANLLLRTRRFDEALLPTEQAVAIDQARLGSIHPLIADDFCDLGLIYAGQKRYEEAARILAYAMALLDQADGQDGSRFAYAELDLAGVLRTMGYNRAAETGFADAKRILDKIEEDDRQREREL